MKNNKSSGKWIEENLLKYKDTNIVYGLYDDFCAYNGIEISEDNFKRMIRKIRKRLRAKDIKIKDAETR